MEDNRLHERYMRRCFDLARLGEGRVSPNPMVGAVLVHQQRIIGEGYHRQYGEAHAEVKAVSSVPSAQRHLIPQSTLYISLEPCCVFGRTPPCTDMILRESIPRVVISTLDTSPEVSGKSVALLRARGVEVVCGGPGKASWPLCLWLENPSVLPFPSAWYTVGEANTMLFW